MLIDSIRDALNISLKKGEATKVSTLRFLLSDIKNYEINQYPPTSGKTITDDEVLTVIKKQVKNHKESIEMFTKGGRSDLVEQEKGQLVILEAYLPVQIGEEEIRKTIQGFLKTIPDKSNFGKVMGVVMGKLGGKADGAVVSRMVKEELTQS